VRLNRVSLAAGVAFALLAFQCGLIGPIAAQAQNLGVRVVTGIVVDAASTPVVGATVFLKNVKSKSIRSYTTTEGGKFRFVQVDMSLDQDLWAEKDGRKSAVKTISTYDTRAEFQTELKLK
jgi:hypothetical protein